VAFARAMRNRHDTPVARCAFVPAVACLPTPVWVERPPASSLSGRDYLR
jgi:hypothetical protein